MGTVELCEDVAGIDEEHLIATVGVALAFVEEPERTGQRHGVEEVGTYGDHYIDYLRFD